MFSIFVSICHLGFFGDKSSYHLIWTVSMLNLKIIIGWKEIKTVSRCVCVRACLCVVRKKEWTKERHPKERLPFPSHLWKSTSGHLGPVVSYGLGQNSYVQSTNEWVAPWDGLALAESMSDMAIFPQTKFPLRFLGGNWRKEWMDPWTSQSSHVFIKCSFS